VGKRVTRPAPDGRGVALLLLGSFLISWSAVFVKVSHVGPSAAGFYRNLFGTIALLAVVATQKTPLWKGWRAMGLALLAGAFFGSDIFCWHRSILYIGPGLATIMGNFQVFVLGAVGIVAFGERTTWRFFLAVPLAVLGLFLLVGTDWRNAGGHYRAGVIFGVLTALNYSGYLLTMRASQRATRKLNGSANLMWVSSVAAAILLLVSLVEGESLRIPDAQTWSALLAYGIVCQAVGWVVISRALPRVDASRVGLLLLLQPMLTFIWDIVLFGRPTTFTEGAGAVLALTAIYLGNMRRVPRQETMA